jgi:hypothetical protein
MTFLTLAMALLIACAHLFTKNIRFLHDIQKNRLLSAAGGISVAFVFVHVLPELEKGQEIFASSKIEFLRYIEHHVYLIAMTGLVVFYILERVVKVHSSSTAPGVNIFWLHITMFFFYNMLILYLLLHSIEDEFWNLFLFTIAMTLHLMTIDHALREAHEERYNRIGRWLLASAVLLGWMLSTWVELNKMATASVFAFLAGAILLNVLKEELPKERNSRIGPFLMGILTYSVLLLVLSALES